MLGAVGNVFPSGLVLSRFVVSDVRTVLSLNTDRLCCFSAAESATYCLVKNAVKMFKDIGVCVHGHAVLCRV